MKYHLEDATLSFGTWWVVDFQGKVVAECRKKHDAQLICKLLNAHT